MIYLIYVFGSALVLLALLALRAELRKGRKK